MILADDDVLLREGVASLLEGSNFEVVGQAGDGVELLDLVHQHEPDLVLVDIRMPPNHSTEGLEAAGAIREAFPQISILVLSAHTEVEHAMELLAGGERIGYLLKSRVTDVDEFLETLERIDGGASVVDPALVQELVAARRAEDPLEELTPREREICDTIGPELRKRGLLFVGIDVIDGNLTEINVTSPTGIRAIQRLNGPDVAAKIWDTIEAKRR